MGTPFISIAAIDHQVDRLKKMDEIGICKYVGDWRDFNEKKSYNLFKSLINDKKEREKMSINGKKLLDGNGTIKIAEIVRGIVKNENK